MTARYLVADVFDGLATLETGSVDLVVTSPPFLALRSYLPADHPDKSKEIGSEPTPAAFLDVMLAVTAELRRVLAPHGSICVELGDTYAGSGGAGGDYGENGLREGQQRFRQRNDGGQYGNYPKGGTNHNLDVRPISGGNGWPLAKSKTLIPELYRIALAYGINPLTGAESPAGRWRIRNNVTWCRPNPPVGALGDKWRPATSDVVVACVSDRRYWDDIATRRPSKNPIGIGVRPTQARVNGNDENDHRDQLGPFTAEMQAAGAPLLDYWEIPPGGYPGSHYAVFPPALVEPLVKAMAPPKVCRTCGEPSRRIVSKQREVAGQIVQGGDWSDHGVNGWKQDGDPSNGQNTRTLIDTLGWTDCGHGSFRCKSCGSTNAQPPAPPEYMCDCGSTDFDYIENHWRPALVLDPFAGSGTTLAVATGHGHDAYGIDLDSRNAELARDRIGPFLFELLDTGTNVP